MAPPQSPSPYRAPPPSSGRVSSATSKGAAFTRSDGAFSDSLGARGRTSPTTGVTPGGGAAASDTAVYALVVGVGNMVSCAGRDKDVRLLDETDGCCLNRMEGHTDRVWALARTGDDMLASGSADKTIRQWRVTSHNNTKCVGSFKGHKGAVMSLLTHRGLLISGSQDQTVKLWDLREGGCVGSLWQAAEGYASKERHAIYSLAIARRDQLATGAWGGTVRIWDLHRSRCTSTIEAHSGAVWSMLQAEGTLYTAGSDGVVKLWDTRTSSPESVGSLGSASTSGPLYAMVERDGLLLTGGYDQVRTPSTPHPCAMAHVAPAAPPSLPPPSAP